MKPIEPIPGPSKSPRTKSKEGLKGKKRGNLVQEVKEVGGMNDEGAMHCRHIATRIVEKKVEIEMLWKEIEALEEMLEE